MLDEIPISFFAGDDLEWQRDALCAEPHYRADDWFENGQKAVDRAKQVCMACLCLRECLAYALDAGISDGLWGACTPAERAQLLDGGVTAEAILHWGGGAFAGLRMLHERELDRRIEEIRFGTVYEELGIEG